MKKTQKSGMIFHAHELEELMLLKGPYYSKQSAESMQSYHNSNGVSHRNRKNLDEICVEP